MQATLREGKDGLLNGLRTSSPGRWPVPGHLLVPSLRVRTIYDIDRLWLKSRNIRGIITDLDNTLVPWRDYSVAGELKGWFQALHDEGFKTLILTNARPSPTVEKLAEELGTRVILGARKPATRYFLRALDLLGTPPSATCVIGDQVFTDVLGGNLVGCYTVLVDRIAPREFIGTRFMRLLERIVLRHLPMPDENKESEPPGESVSKDSRQL